MTGPKGNSEFCGSRGNKTHCFPRGQSLSVLLYLPTQNRTLHGRQFTTLLQNVTNPSNLHIYMRDPNETKWTVEIQENAVPENTKEATKSVVEITE